MISAQDADSARNIEALGAPAPVKVTGSLKPLAPPLAHDAEELESLKRSLAGRPVWVAASTHAEDEVVALAAQRKIGAKRPNVLAIIAPRLPARGSEVQLAAVEAGFQAVRRQKCGYPEPETEVFVADTMGELGLWYRIAKVALVGGTFSSSVQGHNPWESVRVGCPVLYGPHMANFTDDYAALAAGAGARAIGNADELAAAVLSDDLSAMVDRATAVVEKQADRVRALASDIISLLKT